MKKYSVMIVVAVLMGAVPAFSYAATYGYVNTQGVLKTVVASSATQALRLPTDIDPHSGVILLSKDDMTFTASTTIPMSSVTASTSSMMNATSTATSTASTSAMTH